MRFFFFISLLVTFNSTIAQSKWTAHEEDSLNNARLLYDEGNYELAIPIFETLYKKHNKDFFLKYMCGNCSLHQSDKHETALNLLTEVYSINKKAADIELLLAQALHYNYKFDSALVFIDLYLAKEDVTPEKKIVAEQTKKYIHNAKYFYANPTNVKISNVGGSINSKNEEYVPVVTADESMIIYTYKGKESKGGKQNAYQEEDSSGIFYEDVYISEKKDGNWSKPTGIDIINSNSHDAAIAISPDGNQLFTYRNNGSDRGDIYISYLTGKDWSAPIKLKGEVNSNSWEGSCSLTSDGKTLFFSSDRAGGLGGRDIYKATLLADSTWGNSVNMGDSINTPYDDDAPFIHSDGVTLFFSSKGRNSMGDYDVFQSIMNPKDSSFGSPVNLGYPINTPAGDRYYVVTANGQSGYYSSEKRGGNGSNDIYSVTPGYVGKRPNLYLVTGKITENGAPVDSKIDVEITSKNNKLFTTVIPNKATGKYLLALPSGELFSLIFFIRNKLWKTLEVDASTNSNYTEKELDIELNPKAIVSTTESNSKNQFTVPDTTCSGELKFKVQIAAIKPEQNQSFKHLEKFGQMESVVLNDGLKRITIGGIFNTIGEAASLCMKLKRAGQPDAFVTALCNGKRVYLAELKALDIIK